MRLDLRDVIHRPDAEKSFQYQLDLSQLDFYGRKPITRPVVAEGSVINHAGALVLNGTARSELDLVCDRCGKEFSRERSSRWIVCWLRSWRTRTVRTRFFCWTGTSWIWTRWSPRPSSSRWIQQTFAQKTAKGCVPSAVPI